MCTRADYKRSGRVAAIGNVLFQQLDDSVLNIPSVKLRRQTYVDWRLQDARGTRRHIWNCLRAGQRARDFVGTRMRPLANDGA